MCLREGCVILTPKKETASKELRVNARIRAPEVRVVGADGGQIGIMTVRDAMRIAEEQGLDLVEIAPLAKPPVCRLIDYGKFKYEQKKKQAEARKHQVEVVIKEVKMRPKTDIHDFEVKANQAHRFLEEGCKVKATIVFRGREMTHQEIGMEHLVKLAERLQDVGVIEQAARLEGRALGMMIAPKPSKG